MKTQLITLRKKFQYLYTNIYDEEGKTLYYVIQSFLG